MDRFNKGGVVGGSPILNGSPIVGRPGDLPIIGQPEPFRGITINVKYFDQAMPKLEKIDKGDWIDLRAVNIKINGNCVDWVEDGIDEVTGKPRYSISYNKFDYLQVYLGVAMELPDMAEAYVAPRGGTFKNYGFIQTNSWGVVDNSFKGDNDQWWAPELAMRDGKIYKYDRVCQFRLIPKMPSVKFNIKETLGNPDRGSHSSTGVK